MAGLKRWPAGRLSGPARAADRQAGPGRPGPGPGSPARVPVRVPEHHPQRDPAPGREDRAASGTLSQNQVIRPLPLCRGAGAASDISVPARSWPAI